MADKLTVGRAVLVGLLVVNGPVLALLVGPAALFAYLVDHRLVSRDYNWVGVLVFVAGFALAWLWWSLSIGRWRVWAYERVQDIRRLKGLAVAVGLTWPDGHVFEKTEFKSKAVAQRQRELDPPGRR